MTIHTTAADRAALTTTPANDRLLIFQLARLKQEARMSIPDRSRFDDDVAAILNPLAQLRAANDALLAQNESLLDGAAKRQGYVEAIEAQNAALVRRIHELVIGNVLLRHGLDTLAAHLWGAA